MPIRQQVQSYSGDGFPRASEFPGTPHIHVGAAREFQFHHLPQLDGFRGIAVILVLAGHVVAFSSLPIFCRQVGEDAATLGVFLFFVLSGFLITSLLHAEQKNTGKINLRNFYIRRVLRLGPALLVFLSTIVVLMVCGAVTDVPRYEVLATLLYARNFFGHSTSLAHLWSLSLEEQFYLCWPLIFSLVAPRRDLVVSVYATICVAIWRGMAIHFNLFDYGRGIYYERPYFRFDSILIGACFAIALATRPEFFSWARKAGKRMPAIVPWIALLWWTVAGENISKPLYMSIQMLLIGCLFVQLAIAEGGWSLRLFSLPQLGYIGRISYSLYLWQQIFLVTKVPSWGVIRLFPINVLISVALAIASYHLIEKPALQLKVRFQSTEEEDAVEPVRANAFK